MRHKNRSIAGIILGVGGLFLVLLLVSYGFGVQYFTRHFLPNTQLQDMNLSKMTVSQATELVEKEAETQEITFVEGGKTLGYSAIDNLGLKIDVSTNLSSALKQQNAFIWPIAYLSKNKIEFPLAKGTITSGTIDTLMAQLNIDNTKRKPSKNAYIKIEQGRTKVVPSKIGNQVSAKQLGEAIKESFTTGNHTIDIKSTYVQPKIKENDPDFKEKLEKFEKVKNVAITLNVNGEKYPIPSEEIQKWLAINDDGELICDLEQVNLYLQQLNQKISGLLTSHVFHSTLSGDVTVQPGTYGWYINRDVAADQVSKAVLSGKDQTIEPDIAGDGYGNSFFGNTYVEVDLIYQKMFIYHNGTQVLATDIVSGHPVTATTPGAYVINNMQTNTVLKGYNRRFDSKYESPVAYWAPFDFVGQGIHDANWQSAFGGSRYLSHGSNGCINVAPGVMPTVYANLYVGMPVIIF